jgi:hypothetical protein
MKNSRDSQDVEPHNNDQQPKYVEAQTLKLRLLEKLGLLITSDSSAVSLVPKDHYLNILQLMKMPGKNPKSKEFIIETLGKLDVHAILEEAQLYTTPLNNDEQRMSYLLEKISQKINLILNEATEGSEQTVENLINKCYEVHLLLHTSNVLLKKTKVEHIQVLGALKLLASLFPLLKNLPNSYFESREGLSDTVADMLMLSIQFYCNLSEEQSDCNIDIVVLEIATEFPFLGEKFKAERFSPVVERVFKLLIFLSNVLPIRFRLNSTLIQQITLKVTLKMMKFIEKLGLDTYWLTLSEKLIIRNPKLNLYENAFKLLSLFILPYEREGENSLLQTFLFSTSNDIIQLKEEIKPGDNFMRIIREKSLIEWEQVLEVPELLEVSVFKRSY